MHHSYLAHTPVERQSMLAEMGMAAAEDLFAPIPAHLKQFELNISPALSELELLQYLSQMGLKNLPLSQQTSFIGAGTYAHFSPSALDLLITRSEFLTAYTPYQAEISQGTLQAIFEFQSCLCALTGMDIANASTYEGASATAEAILMASRITRRQQILVSAAVHPEYREVLQTYAQATGLDIQTGSLGDGMTRTEAFAAQTEPAALVVQYPNFLGQVEDIAHLAEWVHARQGLLIVVITDPVTLGVLEAPGKLGADIVAGEAQACGNSISFGGPYVGFLATRQTFMRQLPGRMSGLTQDEKGALAFSLVLQTREQHIRREKATSNICTNQGLNALVVTIWLALIGRQGLQEMAQICLQRAHYLAERMAQIPGFRIHSPHPFFHEFVVETDYNCATLFDVLRSQQCIPGVALGRWYPEWSDRFLVTVTEMNAMDDIEQMLKLLTQFAHQHHA